MLVSTMNALRVAGLGAALALALAPAAFGAGKAKAKDCCGKPGSAAYQPDMPIPEKYRFEKNNEQIPQIVERIRESLNHYDERVSDFEPYRQTLYREEEKFISDIQKLFVKE